MSSLAKESAFTSSNKSTPSTKPRVKFDEDGIAVDYAERGVLYGTQTIDQVETPYIYYDSDEDPIVHLNSNTSEELGVPQRMEAVELQAKLGLLLAAQTSAQTTVAMPEATTSTTSTASSTNATPNATPNATTVAPPKWKQAEQRMEFESRRRELYAQEGTTFAKTTSQEEQQREDAKYQARYERDAALPNGWVSMESRADGAVFYYHHDTQTTQWTVPTEELKVVE
jgi:hypothetical protein